MMNWLLIVLAVVLLLCLFLGWKEGLWGSAVTFVTLLLFLFMMNMVLPTVIPNLDIKDEILLQSELNEEKDLDFIIEKLPAVIKDKTLQGYPTYKDVMQADEQLAYMISGKLMSFGVIIAMIITLLFALFVLRPIGALHDMLLKFPIVGKFDRMIGVVVGAMNAVIIMYMIFIGIAMYSGTEIGTMLYNMVYESELLTSLHENNLLIKLFY